MPSFSPCTNKLYLNFGTVKIHSDFVTYSSCVMADMEGHADDVTPQFLKAFLF